MKALRRGTDRTAVSHSRISTYEEETRSGKNVNGDLVSGAVSEGAPTYSRSTDAGDSVRCIMNLENRGKRA